MSSRPLYLTLFVSLLLLGCSPAVTRTAPFRARPDSTAAGSLAGPFSGQVKDAASGDPVPGAMVYATWSYERNHGVATPAGVVESIASTDANGRYALDTPALKKAQKSTGAMLTAFHLVIYKKGYVAYRSDRRFSDFGPRQDFAQKHNEVSLERWHSEHSHVRHLRYVGGGSALSALTAWERSEAGAELSGSKPGSSPRSDLLATLSDGRLVAAQLLGEAEIKKITGFEGAFETGPLNDEADTNDYSSQHFKALGQPEIYDVALRLWRIDEPGATQRFEELLTTLPGVTEHSGTDDIADRSLLALEGDIQGVAFLDTRRSLVVLITCGKGQCSGQEQLLSIAQKIYENIGAVMPHELP